MKEKMMERLEACFDRLQVLDIQPTLKNLEILTQTLYDLRDVYQMLGGDEDGRSDADSCGRDDH